MDHGRWFALAPHSSASVVRGPPEHRTAFGAVQVSSHNGDLMHRRLKIGVLYSRVRVEEKWIFGALEKRGIDYDRLDDRAIHFDLNCPEPWQQYEAVLERSISFNNGLYALRLLNAFGVPTVNTAQVAEICGDKLMTSACFARDGIPQPHNTSAFTPEAALEAIEAMGYPVVLKPVVCSWGRLLAKVIERA